jgi:hypothetical protein
LSRALISGFATLQCGKALPYRPADQTAEATRLSLAAAIKNERDSVRQSLTALLRGKAAAKFLCALCGFVVN